MSETTKPTPSFLSALRDATTLPGETLSEFSAQYKKLTPQDKTDLSRYLSEAGITHEPPKGGVS